MNCARFNERIPEFLDGVLPTEEAAAMRRHSGLCPACSEALERDRALGCALREALQQESANLAMGPELATRMLAAAAGEAPGPLLSKTGGGAQRWKQWLRPCAIAAACLTGLVFCLDDRRPADVDQSREGVTPPAAGQIRAGGCSVDIPYHYVVHLAQVDNERSQDAMITGAGLIHLDQAEPGAAPQTTTKSRTTQ